MAEDFQEMIELICPGAERKERCREKIDKAIAEIKKAHDDRELYLPINEIKAQMKVLHGALKKTERLCSTMNPIARPFLFSDHPEPSDPRREREAFREIEQDRGRVRLVNAADFASDLTFLIRQTGKIANGWPPAPPARRTKARVLAAQAAFRLIADFALFAPRDTKDGPFFKLAGKLLKAATEEEREPDLTRDCREILHDYKVIGETLKETLRDQAAIEETLNAKLGGQLEALRNQAGVEIGPHARAMKATVEKLARVRLRKQSKRRTHS